MTRKSNHIAVCAKVTKTSFDIPTSLKTSFKMKVVKDGASMGAVVIKLIQAYVNGKINLEGI